MVLVARHREREADEQAVSNWGEAREGLESGAGVGAWWEPPVVWEEVELALEPWRVSGRGEVMAMAASLREIAAAGGTGGVDTPTLTMCFCELLRQVTNHCSERGRLMAHIWTSLTRQLVESETVAEMGERVAQLEGELSRAAAVHGARGDAAERLVAKLVATLDALVPHWRCLNPNDIGLATVPELALSGAGTGGEGDTGGGAGGEHVGEEAGAGEKKKTKSGAPEGSTAAVLEGVTTASRQGLGHRASMGPLVYTVANLPVEAPVAPPEEPQMSEASFTRGKPRKSKSRGLEASVDSMRAQNAETKTTREKAADACLRADVTRLAAGIGMQLFEKTTVTGMVEAAVGEERRTLTAEKARMKEERKKFAEQITENEALHARIKQLNDKVASLENELAQKSATIVQNKADHDREILELKEMLEGQMSLERERARRATEAMEKGGSAGSAAVVAAHETIRQLTGALRTLAWTAANDAARTLARLGIHPGGSDGATIAAEVREEENRRRFGGAGAGLAGTGGSPSSPEESEDGFSFVRPRVLPPDIRPMIREAASAAAARKLAREAAVKAAADGAGEAAPSPEAFDAAEVVNNISEEELLRRWANWAIVNSGTSWVKEMTSLGVGLKASYPLAVMSHKLCPREMPSSNINVVLEELDSREVANAALAALSAGAGTPAGVVTAEEVVSGNAEDMGFAFLGHVFMTKPMGPPWAPGSSGGGAGEGDSYAGSAAVERALDAAKEQGDDKIGRMSRRKRVAAVLKVACTKTGVPVDADGVPVGARGRGEGAGGGPWRVPEHPQLGGSGPRGAATAEDSARRVVVPPVASLSAVSGAVRAALAAVAETPDPKGAIGKAAAAALREEELEEAADLTAFAPHVAVLQAAVAAAEADAAEAEAVYRVASSRIVGKALEMLASRARGEVVELETENKRSEAVAYTELQRHKMRELFASDEECDAELVKLSKSLGGYFNDVKRIYAHYSGGATMSPHGFWTVVRDCKLVNKRLTPTKIDIIYLRVNVDNQDGDGNAEDVDKVLTPGEFIEALVRMAHGRVPDTAASGTLTSKFESMMADLVIPHACQSNSDEFRNQLAVPEVRKVYGRYRVQLRAIFVHFAAADNKGGRDKLNCISLEEFLMMFSKADLTSVVPIVHAKRIFALSQVDDDASEMIFQEFSESIGALAQYADPNPYVPLAKRLDSFCRVILIPNLLKSGANIKGLELPEGLGKEKSLTGAEAAAEEEAEKAVAERSAGFEKDQGDREKRVTKLTRLKSVVQEKSG